MVATLNSLNPYSSKSFGLQHLHCDGDQNLGGVAFAPHSTDRVDSVSECKIGFIDLNLTMEQFPVRANHCTAQSVQHSPRRLVAAQTKNSLQPQCADAMLLVGDVPNGGEPEAKFGARFIKNGACCYCCLMSTCRTDQSATATSPNLRNHTALRTNQSVRPTELFQIVPACLFRVEPIKELNPGRWIVFPAYRSSCWRVHLTILPSVELKGYPVILTSLQWLACCVFCIKKVTTKVEGSQVIQRRGAENAEQDEGETNFFFFLCGSLRTLRMKR